MNDEWGKLKQFIGKLPISVVPKNDEEVDLGSASKKFNNLHVKIGHIDNYIPLAQKGAANGVAELDADSKVPIGQLPASVITDIHVVADEAAQLALTVQKGDVCVRSDQSKSYVALNSDNVDMGDWQELLTPVDLVLSVNGEVGVVSLDLDDIEEGTTYKRVTATKEAQIHVQGTDQKLDEGGANEVAVADVKDAVDKKHSQNTDNALGAQSENLDMNTHKIVSVVDPTANQDAATKKYVDDNVMGVSYGVAWDESSDTYTRTGLAAGHPSGFTLSDYLLPIQSKMRRCVISDAGVVQYYLGSTDSTKKENMSTASDLTGADGQVVVEIPKFWYKHSYTGTKHTWEISNYACDGFSVHPAFLSGATEYDFVYVGAYEGILYDVSASIYANGIYQTAVSCVFANADSSLTIASRTGVFSKLAVGDKIVVSGTVANNGTKTVASLVSTTKITISEAVTDGTDAATVIQTEKDWTASTGDKLCSVSGKAPINYGTRANFRAIATNRGTGWTSMLYDILSAIQILYLTEYASFNSQSVIGAGISNVTDWEAYNKYNPIAFNGNSNSVGNVSGNNAGSASCATEATKYMSYRGIENWYGHVWKWLDGINTNNNRSYICNVVANLADDTSSNYTDIGINNVASNGYQATLLQIARGFLPASIGATSATKITDYYWQAGGWRVARSGGSTNYGLYDGGFYLNLSYDSSSSRSYVGGRLCFRK